MCIYIHLYLNAMLSTSLCQQASCSLDANVQGLVVYRVAQKSSFAMFSCCQQPIDKPTDSPGVKAGKEGYLQRLPRPSVRECRRENRSVFISCPWASVLRGRSGWMENLSTIICGSLTSSLQSTIILSQL